MRDLLHFAQHAFERVLGHAGMVAQCAKRQALPFQVLQQRADVGALAGVEQVEQGGDGDLVLAEISLASEEEQPVEQVFQPQISADALVEGYS